MGTKAGIRKMKIVVDLKRERMEKALEMARFGGRYRAAKAHAREVLGDGYDAWVDAQPDDLTFLEWTVRMEGVKYE